MNKFKTLGWLTLEEKKPIWKSEISGSQIGRILTEPDKVYNEKKGIDEPFDPNANAKIKEIMDAGTYQEEFILREAKHWGQLPETVKVDKQTYRSTTFPLRTANLDGYIGRDVNDIDWIVEIKNTVTTDVNQLIERYQAQLLYYVWFFNAKKGGIFIFRIQGRKTIKVELRLETHAENILQMLKHLMIFEECIENDIPIVIAKVEEEDLKYHEINILSIYMEELMTKKAKLLELKKEVESMNKEVLNSMQLKDCYYSLTKEQKIIKEIVERKGIINYSQMFAFLAEKYNFDMIATQNRFRNEDKTSESIKITKLSKKDLKNIENK